MFVGHYGPSFAAKGMRKSIPLWVLFIAVQLLDVFGAYSFCLGLKRSASLLESQSPIHSIFTTCRTLIV